MGTPTFLGQVRNARSMWLAGHPLLQAARSWLADIQENGSSDSDDVRAARRVVLKVEAALEEEYETALGLVSAERREASKEAEDGDEG